MYDDDGRPVCRAAVIMGANVILICGIAWMNEYKGLRGKNDDIIRGGSENGSHEACNFLVADDGNVYGHIETSKGENTDRKIQIDKLGANGAAQVSGIDVYWAATPPQGGRRVVGWYRNATVFRERQEHRFPSQQHKIDGINTYRVVARGGDVFLLEPNQRTLLVPKSILGHFPCGYYEPEESNEFNDGFKELISSEAPATTDGNADEEGGRYKVWGTKFERSLENRRLCVEHWGCFCQGCGFNFEAVYGEIGRALIHIHHLIPLCEGNQNPDPKKDMIPLCPNCHCVVHRRKPLLSIDELRSLLKNPA